MTDTASTHPQELGLVEQVQALRDGDVAPEELLAATISRIAEEDEFGAFNGCFPEESARMLADVRARRSRGPLHGVPIAVKDAFALPWRAPRDGLPEPPARPGRGESEVYRRLAAGGAVIVGSTNMHQLGIGSTGHISADGPVRNPYDPTRCAGGSSGGSAAAVAARMVAGAVGVDGGGSVRIPAAYCGLVGLKPTWGPELLRGSTTGFSSMAAVGPLTRTAVDARLLGEVLVGRPLPRDRTPRRIGLVDGFLWDDVAPEVRQRASVAVEALEGLGHMVVPVHPRGLEHSLVAAVIRTAAERSALVNAEWMRETGPLLHPMIRGILKARLTQSAALLVRSDRLRTFLRSELAALFAGVDVLAWPTVPTVPPEVNSPRVTLPSGTVAADIANVRQNGVANLTGTPAVSIPCGTSEGLPVGLMLLGRWQEEGTLLDLAEDLDDVRG